MRLIRKKVQNDSREGADLWSNARRYEKETHLIVPWRATINRDLEHELLRGIDREAKMEERQGSAPYAAIK